MICSTTNDHYLKMVHIKQYCASKVSAMCSAGKCSTVRSYQQHDFTTHYRSDNTRPTQGGSKLGESKYILTNKYLETMTIMNFTSVHIKKNTYKIYPEVITVSLYVHIYQWFTSAFDYLRNTDHWSQIFWMLSCTSKTENCISIILAHAWKTKEFNGLIT